MGNVTPKHVILFGGSFDPIHRGHVNAVDALQRAFPDALVLVMPSKNRLKETGLIPIESRVKSSQAAFSRHNNVLVVDWTLTEDTSSTYEVIQKIKGLYPNCRISVSAGEDILLSLPRWKYYEKLISDVEWIFFLRHRGSVVNNLSEDKLKSLAQASVVINYAFEELSSTKIRNGEELPEGVIPQDALPYIVEYLKKNFKS